MRYPCPSKLRRVAKWVGLGLCVVILCLWSMSSWITFHYTKLDTNGFVCTLEHGRIHLNPQGWDTENFHIFRVISNSLVMHLYWTSNRGRTEGMPLWMPFCAIAIPTTILWYRDRRGHCPHCGYNLTGNESGVCPECATPVPLKAK